MKGLSSIFVNQLQICTTKTSGHCMERRKNLPPRCYQPRNVIQASATTSAFPPHTSCRGSKNVAVTDLRLCLFKSPSRILGTHPAPSATLEAIRCNRALKSFHKVGIRVGTPHRIFPAMCCSPPSAIALDGNKIIEHLNHPSMHASGQIT